jgi:small subunit ribosomal protein S8
MSIVNAPVHDMLIRIKNAYMARRKAVDNIIYSKFKEEILKLLKKYGFIVDYQVKEEGPKKYIVVYLKEVKDPVNDIPVIKFYSKPGRRWYIGYTQIKPVAGGRGIGIMSTSKGVMAAHEAKKQKL